MLITNSSNRKTLILTLLLLSLLSSGCAHWSKGDTVRQLAITGLIAIDCVQTHSFVSNGYSELNPLLGSHPSSSEIYAWSATGALLAWGISALLPPKWRAGFQYILLGAEGYNVIRNELETSE